MQCDQLGNDRSYVLLFLKGNVIRNIPSLVLENQVIPSSAEIQGGSTLIFLSHPLITPHPSLLLPSPPRTECDYSNQPLLLACVEPTSVNM